MKTATEVQQAWLDWQAAYPRAARVIRDKMIDDLIERPRTAHENMIAAIAVRIDCTHDEVRDAIDALNNS